MEQRNGGDSLAPPRPPKHLPGVHRSNREIVDAPMMSASFRHGHRNRTNITTTTAAATTTAASIQNPSAIELLSQSSHRDIITTVPLTPLHSPVSTFSRTTPLQQTTNTNNNNNNINNNNSSSSSSSILSHTPSVSTISTNDNTANPVSLTIPRPKNERLSNEYVDTPLRGLSYSPNRLGTHDLQSANIVPNLNQPTINSSSTNCNKLLVKVGNKNQIHGSRSRVHQLSRTITKQPLASYSKDRIALHEDADTHSVNIDPLNSITCPQCQRCRCRGCQKTRQLPSRWLCDDTCLCSAESVIDYASCLCCVKALYYHCSKDIESDREGGTITCADDPCSCLPHKRALRWSCLASLSVILPCLLCYWPMKGCVTLCANCYAQKSRHGCRCHYSNNINNKNSNSSVNSPLSQHRNNDLVTGRSIAVNVLNSDLHYDHHNLNYNHHNLHNAEHTPEKRLLESSPEL